MKQRSAYMADRFDILNTIILFIVMVWGEVTSALRVIRTETWFDASPRVVPTQLRSAILFYFFVCSWGGIRLPRPPPKKSAWRPPMLQWGYV